MVKWSNDYANRQSGQNAADGRIFVKHAEIGRQERRERERAKASEREGGREREREGERGGGEVGREEMNGEEDEGVSE